MKLHESVTSTRVKNSFKTLESSFRAVHGDRYDYSQVFYKRNHMKVRIICPEHGVFEQTPNGHKGGSCCPQCAEGSDNNAIYIWRSVGEYFNGKPVYKVGVTSERLGVKRINQVAKRSGRKAEIVTLEETNCQATIVETLLKNIGDNPNWTGFDGATEFRAFSLSELQEAKMIIDKYKKNTITPSYISKQKLFMPVNHNLVYG